MTFNLQISTFYQFKKTQNIVIVVVVVDDSSSPSSQHPVLCSCLQFFNRFIPVLQFKDVL